MTSHCSGTPRTRSAGPRTRRLIVLLAVLPAALMVPVGPTEARDAPDGPDGLARLLDARAPHDLALGAEDAGVGASGYHDVSRGHEDAGPRRPCLPGDSSLAAAQTCTAFVDALQRGGVRHLRAPSGEIWTQGVPMRDSLHLVGVAAGATRIRLHPTYPADGRRTYDGFYQADPTRPLVGVRLAGFTQVGVLDLREDLFAAWRAFQLGQQERPARFRQQGLGAQWLVDFEAADVLWTRNVLDGVYLGGHTRENILDHLVPTEAINHNVRFVGGAMAENGRCGFTYINADSLVLAGVTVRDNQQGAVRGWDLDWRDPLRPWRAAAMGPRAPPPVDADGDALPIVNGQHRYWASQVNFEPNRPTERATRIWFRDVGILNTWAGAFDVHTSGIRGPGAPATAAGYADGIHVDGMQIVNDPADPRYAGLNNAITLKNGDGFAADPDTGVEQIRNVYLRDVTIRGHGVVDGSHAIWLKGGSSRRAIETVVIERLDVDARGLRPVGGRALGNRPFFVAHAVRGLEVRDSVLRTEGPAMLLNSTEAIVERTGFEVAQGFGLRVQARYAHVAARVRQQGNYALGSGVAQPVDLKLTD